MSLREHNPRNHWPLAKLVKAQDFDSCIRWFESTTVSHMAVWPSGLRCWSWKSVGESSVGSNPTAAANILNVCVMYHLFSGAAGNSRICRNRLMVGHQFSKLSVSVQSRLPAPIKAGIAITCLLPNVDRSSLDTLILESREMTNLYLASLKEPMKTG